MKIQQLAALNINCGFILIFLDSSFIFLVAVTIPGIQPSKVMNLLLFHLSWIPEEVKGIQHHEGLQFYWHFLTVPRKQRFVK
jgi:hypothetical protein